MFESYVTEPVASARPGRSGKMLSVYLGLAALLVATALVAVNSRGGAAAKLPRVLVPKANSACTTPPNGYLYSNTVDGTTFNVCISQEGNINKIEFPTAGNNHIAWDGYCLVDFTDGNHYNDYSPGSGISFTGWGAATLTVAAANQVNVTRTTLDNKFQLTQFIKINFQPRSVFVGMTVKNIDPANVTHSFYFTRNVAPKIEGDATNDQYNEYGVGSSNFMGNPTGRTGHAWQSPGPGKNSLLFGPTQQNGLVVTETVTNAVISNGCAQSADPPGAVTSGNHVFWAALGNPSSGDAQFFSLAHNASVNVGKFVYRMV